MNRHAKFIVHLAAFCVCASWAGGPVPSADRAGSQLREKQRPKGERKENISSLTGCVHDPEGYYVLVDVRNLNPITLLETNTFPTEGFANHMGRQVTVRGAPIPDRSRPALKVRPIKTVSESCAPQPTRQQA